MTSKTALLIALFGATALTAPAQAQQGFSISIDGEALSGDPVVADVVRQTDVALANADVQVRFDGLGVEPRLDVEISGSPALPGDQISLQSALNYPAFVSRAEMRIIDRAALGGARTVSVTPVNPNGSVTLTVPEGRELVVVHRVYDNQGRFDETAPRPIGQQALGAGVDGVEDGIDSTALRGIRVTGGAITVSGSDVANGAQVRALGEVVPTDPSGGFVIQRILPAGSYGVDVTVNGGGQALDVTRDVTIPRGEWFYVATADLTFGIRDGDSGRETYETGRLAGFVNGKTDTGLRIIASVDSGEGPLKDVFRRFDDRDPRQLLQRIDPDDLYPTYGDDSSIEDLTPTSGRIFVRIEKDRNYVQWGDFDAQLSGNTFARNERSLYGLSAGAETQSTTSQGEARASVAVYAAQPDQLPQRDTFVGTGGTVYFLDKQDITQGSETLSLQLRDPDTGRVRETRTLIAGQDYQINYIQGLVTLSQPLQSTAASGLFNVGSASRDIVVLVAAYEHTPTLTDVDGYAVGGRVEGWATDELRFGLSAMLDETGTTDHRLIGADILYQVSEDTFARLDVAKSEGTGFDSTLSADGGLIVDTITATGTEGTAIKLEARAGMADLGWATDGAVGGYFERRTEGFAALDANVTAATGDETFWGLFADVALSEQVTLSAEIDAYEAETGARDTSGNVQLVYQATDELKYAVGVETQDKVGVATPGQRTDLAARVDYAPTPGQLIYAYGQATVDRSGLPENNRLGIGASYEFDSGWTVAGEVSDGSLGTGGLLSLGYQDDAGNTRYLGYEIEPGRDLDGVALRGQDRGRIVAGGTQVVSDTVDMFGENTYDIFGAHKSLTSAYGLTYRPTDQLSYTTAVEIGTVNDGSAYDFERQAISLGVIYADETVDAAARVEYRREDGMLNGVDVTADTLLVSGDATYKIDEERRLAFSGDVARSETSQSTLLDGNYADVALGYAYRPVEDDRLNVLARYRYLYDLYGLRDAQAADGPRQRSHVLSVDASYDVDTHWTVGGKLGYRLSESAANSASAFTSNDAWLAVANARYHMVSDWDALVEVRQLNLVDAQTSETSLLGAVYKHVGDNVKVGVGYNFGRFSDDLTDLTFDDQGAFLNIVAKF